MANYYFCCASEQRFGGGHIMRCLALAETAYAAGHQVHFYLHPDALKYLEHHPQFILNAHADYTTVFLNTFTDDPQSIVILDHYQLDSNFEKNIKPLCLKLIVLDDVPNRHHQADILIDFGATPAQVRSKYLGVINPDCKLLAGADYIFIRDEFKKLHCTNTRKLNLSKVTILISTGTQDGRELVPKILSVVTEFPSLYQIKVVLEPTAKSYNRVLHLAARDSRVQLLTIADGLIQHYQDVNFAIGAAGFSAWERCYLAIPSILIKTANNQSSNYRALVEAQAAVAGGSYTEFNVRQLQELIEKILNEATLKHMRARCQALCDGNGTQRILQAIEEISLPLVP